MSANYYRIPAPVRDTVNNRSPILEAKSKQFNISVLYFDTYDY